VSVHWPAAAGHPSGGSSEAPEASSLPGRPVAQATAAVLVVFHPESDPLPLIERLSGSVAHVLLVDNSLQGHPALVALPVRAGLHRLRNANLGGLAGAYNRAREALARLAPEVRQLVFVDEDSDATVLDRFLADPDVQARLADATTAAVAPAYCDRATGLRGKHMLLSRWRWHGLPRQFEGMRPVSFLINSMSVWRCAALDRLGPFDEGLRIDHVDTDYCLRARRAGLSLWLHGSHEFRHAIGERRRFRLFGVEMQAGGHPPARRYLIGRNTAWLARRSLWHEPSFTALCIARLAYEAVGIVMAEPDRGPKLRALLRGACVGLLSRRLA
jgi:rhamnosyltransferase